MKDNSKKTILINHIGLIIYLLYMLWVVVIEWINFFIKVVFRVDLRAGIAEIVAFILILAVILVTKKYFVFQLLKIDIGIFLGTFIILIIGFFFSAFPDGGFDTFNYHLIAQNPKFENYFVEDFGYGNFQVWGFRLCDRMFYYFRSVLGYRMGTMLNTIALIISYGVVYDILGYLTGENEISLVKQIVMNRVIWSLVIVFSLDSIMMLGSYYIDAISMPLGLSVVQYLLKKSKTHIDSLQIAIFALLCGLWIGTKLTNVVYVFPCVIAFLAIHIKEFHVYDWITSVLLGVFSYLDYIIFNYISTGNPFFPYYNSIFKSMYFPYIDFKDDRWGGQNLFEKFFWLVYAAIRPDYRQSEIWDTKNALLLLGLVSGVVMLVYIAYSILKKKIIDIGMVTLFAIAIMSAVLWGFTTGISRYYMIGRVIWGILAYGVIIRIVFRWEKKIIYVSSFILSIIVLVSMCHNFASSAKNGGWTMNLRSWSSFVAQMSYVFRDKGNISSEDMGMFVLSNPMSMGVAELFDSDSYVFFLNYYGDTEFDEKKVLDEKLLQYEFGYDLHKRDFSDIEDYISQLNSYNLRIVDIGTCKTDVGDYQTIKLKDDDRQNILWTSNDETAIIDVSNVGQQCVLSFIGGMIYDWPVRNIKLVISSEDGIIGEVAIDAKHIQKYEQVLEFDTDTNRLFINACYADNNEIISKEELDYVFCLNFNVQ